jgi:hypothetical protein
LTGKECSWLQVLKVWASIDDHKVMIIKVKKLLWLRQARIVFEPSEESQVQNTGVPVVQW